MGPCLNTSLTVHHHRRRCSITATVVTFEHLTRIQPLQRTIHKPCSFRSHRRADELGQIHNSSVIFCQFEISPSSANQLLPSVPIKGEGDMATVCAEVLEGRTNTTHASSSMLIGCVGAEPGGCEDRPGRRRSWGLYSEDLERPSLFNWGTEASVSEVLSSQPNARTTDFHFAMQPWWFIYKSNFWSFLKGNFYCQVCNKNIVPCERTWNHAVHSWRRWSAATKTYLKSFTLKCNKRWKLVTFFQFVEKFPAGFNIRCIISVVCTQLHHCRCCIYYIS